MITKSLKKTTLMCLFSIVYMQQLHAQEKRQNDIEIHKNSVSLSAGTIGIYFSATAYYERIVASRGEFTFFLRSGVGAYEILLGKGGQYLVGQAGFITNQGKHHLELSAGPNWFLNGDFQGELPIGGGFGYRLQKPGSNFMFRTGISAPEAIYVGVGIPF